MLFSTVEKRAANFLIENQIITSYLVYESTTLSYFAYPYVGGHRIRIKKGSEFENRNISY